MYVGGWTWKIAAGSFFLFLFSFLLFFFFGQKANILEGFLFQEILGEGNAADMSNLNLSTQIFNTWKGDLFSKILYYIFSKKDEWLIPSYVFSCDLYVCFCALIILLWLCHFWSIIGDNDTRIKFSSYLLVIKFMWVL